MKVNKRIIAGLLLSMMVTLSACEEPENAIEVLEIEQSAMEEEQIATVKRGKLEIYSSIEGYVSPKVHQMKFAIQGKFGEYCVKIGDTVTKGQVLATLNATPYNERVEELQEQLTDLNADYAYEKTYNEKTMEAYGIQIEGYGVALADTEREWKEGEETALFQKKCELEEAKKRLELINKQLQQTYELNRKYLQTELTEAKSQAASVTIVSPCEGTVVALQDMQDMPQTNENMYYVAVAEKDVYYLQCDYISGAYLKSLKKICGIRNGKEYELTYVPYEDDVLLAMKNSGEKLYTNFEITNPDENIQYGDNATIKLIATTKKKVLLVPNHAISYDEGGRFVYKKTEDGREKVYITKGSSDGIHTEVKEGLKKGDEVYVQK